MLKSFIRALVVVAGLGWAGMSCAVGFGSATVSSALGQPLRVEIALMAVSEADRINLTARLASPDAFKAAGLDYPYHLSKLKFDIVTRNEQTYIEVTSKDAVNDSFVNLLVELSWSSGRLLREYTFLLDPPDYKAEQPKAEEVTPIEPVVAPVAPPESPQVEALPEATTASAPAAVPAESLAAEAAAASAPAGAPSAEESAAVPPAPAPELPTTAEPTTVPPTVDERPRVAETITVKGGDTLTKIAAQIQEPDVTLEQMLVALYRANVNKFDGKNMNRLRAGKILTVPDQAALERISNAAAIREIRIQTANWNAYRQKLATAAGAAAPEAPKQEAAGKISTSVADKTPAAKESAKEVLKLSKGETPGKPETKDQGKEEAIAKENAAKESAERAALLEKNVKDMEKLMELKGTPPAGSAVPAPASAVHPGKPKILPTPPVPAPEPSLLDEILSNPVFDNPILKDPVYLGGGVAGLLILAGAGVYLVRRRGMGGGGRKKKR